MNQAMPPLLALDAILTQAQHLLFDFDGPICALSHALASQQPADQLRQTITQDGAPLPAEVEATADPLVILCHVASQSADRKMEIS